MRWSLRVGSPFGIRIELHVTFLLFLGWIAISQGLLSGNPARALISVLLFLLVFVCVVLHELGHALMARRYGIRTRDIVLLPIGGVARLERMPDKPQQEIAIALAGPAVNLGILLVLFALRLVFDGGAVIEGGLLDTLLLVNIVMIAFNLIPAFPMDGGRVLRALLALRMPYARATAIAANVGQAFALLFAVVGLFSNHMLVFVALFVFLAASEERALVEARSRIAGLPVQAAMITDFAVLDLNDPLSRPMELLVSGAQQDFPVLDGDATVGMLTRDDLIRALQSGGTAQRVGDVMRPPGDFAEAGEPLEDVVARMRAAGRAALPVMSHGNLLGLVTLENVGDLLLMQDAMRRSGGAR